MKGTPPRYAKAMVALIHDVVMAAISFVAALYLRIGDLAYQTLTQSLLPALAVFTIVCAVVFWSTGLYRGIWRYASLSDMMAIAKAVTLALLIYLPITFLLTRLEAVPRSMLVINWFVLAFLLSAPRLIYRVTRDRGFRHLLERRDPSGVPVLLVGADDNADAFIREMARDRSTPYDVLGVIDEKGTRVGRQIRGVRVMGTLDELDKIIDSVSRTRIPQRLILTKALPRETMTELLEDAEKRGMTLSRLPRLTDFKSGDSDAIALRPIAIEDLLRRPQTKLDRAGMHRLIAGRRVLVSGAGGTIGSELVRQIAAFEPAEMVLLDNSEFQLYAIDLQLAERYPDLPRRAVLGDVRDRARLDQVLAEEQPELVFHAAALKHVPMVEANPAEGILTNVIGTRNMAEAARAAGAIAMVLISTDKAVNPSSVMGASKRLAESYCQALDIDGRAKAAHGAETTRYVTVRFGNVLGSTGSVVPLFERQLKAGGPLTVTHPEMTRYFMTVREAVELVLQASAMGIDSPQEDTGKIYVLDMGAPIKIVELAQQMIRLAGLRPGKDVAIEFTGLRPGEKLAEELFHHQEPMIPTNHSGLQLASPRTFDRELLERGLTELESAAEQRNEATVLNTLARLLPDYDAPKRPQTSAETKDSAVAAS